MLLLLPFVRSQKENLLYACVSSSSSWWWWWGIDFHSLARGSAIFGKLISVVLLPSPLIRSESVLKQWKTERTMCAVDCKAKCILVSGHYHKSSPIPADDLILGCSLSQSVGLSFRLPQSFAELDGKCQCGSKSAR